MRKLHFTILNYTLNYTLHHKLSDCTLCTLNYNTYHALHPSVIFAVIFNRILLHVTSTYFLLRWNKVRRLKHPSLNSIKTKPNFFLICLVSHQFICTLPLSKITQNLRVGSHKVPYYEAGRFVCNCIPTLLPKEI